MPTGRARKAPKTPKKSAKRTLAISEMSDASESDLILEDQEEPTPTTESSSSSSVPTSLPVSSSSSDLSTPQQLAPAAAVPISVPTPTPTPQAVAPTPQVPASPTRPSVAVPAPVIPLQAAAATAQPPASATTPIQSTTAPLQGLAAPSTVPGAIPTFVSIPTAPQPNFGPVLYTTAQPTPQLLQPQATTSSSDPTITALLAQMVSFQQQLLERLAAQSSPAPAPLHSSVSSSTIAADTQQPKPRYSKPKKFKGKGEQDATRWLYLLKTFIEGERTPPEEQVKLASTLLEDNALVWYLSVESEIEDFEDFQRKFLIRFKNPMEDRIARSKLATLRQGKGSYQQYERKFDELVLKLADELSESEKFNRFFEGLSDPLKKRIIDKNIPKEDQTLERIKLEARIGDEILRLSDSYDYPKEASRRRSFQDKANDAVNKAYKTTKIPSTPCPICGEKGHWSKHCPKKVPKKPMGTTPPQSQSQNRSHPPQRTTPQTPTKPTGSNVRVASAEENTDIDEAFSRRLVQVVQRVIAATNNSESMKPPNEFLMKGSINGHTVRVLLDSGATHSFIDSKIAEKLNLKIKNCDMKIGLASSEAPKCKAIGMTRQRIDMGAYSKTMDFIVMNCSNDVVLGYDWFRKQEEGNAKVHLSYQTGDATIEIKPGVFVPLPRWHEPTEIKYVSPSQMRRSMRKNRNTSKFFRIIAHYTDLETEVAEARKVSEVKTTRPSLPKPERDPRANWIFEEFADLFPEELPPGLPPKRPTDLKIELYPDAPICYTRQYPLNPLQSADLTRQVRKHVEGGRVRDSFSPYNSASIMEYKPGSNEFRWCVDFRKLNMWTKPDPYPIPNADRLLDKLSGAKVFSKIDFLHGYFQCRISEESVPYTAFSTEEGHYEFLVMPLGLKNAPAAFMRTMHFVFKDLVLVCVVIFFDDIAVYSRNDDEHTEHLRKVLTTMRENRLYASAKKCMFYLPEIPFIGFIAGGEGLKTDPSIISTVKNFVPPRSVREVQIFLGLTGFYRRFIANYALIALPLTDLLKAGTPFKWTPECQAAFETLRDRLCSAPVLILPDFNLMFVVTTDAGNGTIAGVLQQDQGKGLQPVRYWSRKMNQAERNYSTTEQELLAVVEAIKTWSHYLVGRQFILETDHKALLYIFTQPKLSPRQCRWLNLLAGFDFKIKYLEGRKNVVADGLTRLETIEDVTNKPTLGVSLRAAYVYTSDLMSIIAKTPYSEAEVKNYSTNEYYKRGSIYFKIAPNGQQDLVCVPRDSKCISMILESLHDEPTSGHLGVDKTLAAVRSRFYWPGMYDDVHKFVSSCLVCQKIKKSNKKEPGSLMPLPIPDRPWGRVHWDFITGLPLTINGNDAISTAVCALTKMAHFSPCKTTDDSKDAAIGFINNVVKLHGLPDVTTTDRDPKFISKFHQELFKRLGVRRIHTTAYHPQSNGQAEIVNKSIVKMLRAFANEMKEDWDEHLGILEFAYNSAIHSTTKHSPFYLNYGFEPKKPIDLEVNANSDRSMAQLEKLHERIKKANKITSELIAKVQEKMKKRSDKKRRPLEFKEGDLVLLSAENINQPAVLGSYKLNAKYLGPFTVKKRISPVDYELDLPSNFKIHSVFHVSKLKEYKMSDAKFGPRSSIPDPVVIDGETEYEVEAILDEGINDDGQRMYLVKWKGYDSASNSWQPASDLTHCDEVLKKWEEYKEKHYGIRRKQLKSNQSKKKPKQSSRTMTQLSGGDC